MNTKRIPSGRGETREYETEFEDIPLTLVLKCARSKCKHKTVVRLIKGRGSVGYYHNKKCGTFDVRNVGFVCDDHQVSYDKWYCGQSYHRTYGMLPFNRSMA